MALPLENAKKKQGGHVGSNCEGAVAIPYHYNNHLTS